MGERILCNLPLNRTEGDLEIRVAVEDGRIVEAFSAGTLYRGFENLLVGRAALDALVITPRICGICTTTHLNAAAKCLDAVAGIVPPDNGIRIRNLALLLEHIQSDVRQTVLMFMVDFANPAYAGRIGHAEAARRYAPLAGSACIETLRETKRLIEIIAILGGQWPHSSFMVPGGVTQMPSRAEINTARQIVRRFRLWYERQVLGCTVERWQAVASLAALDAWLGEEAAHRASDLGWLLTLGREYGLEATGAGCGRYLSHGLADLPAQTGVGGRDGCLFAAGVCSADGRVTPFEQARVGESIARSHYRGAPAPVHPYQGTTDPLPPDASGHRYSYAKAPRYDGEACETGPLAEALVAGIPLFRDWLACRGASTLVRQVARLTRPARLFGAIDAWLAELLDAADAPFIVHPGETLDGEGFGAVNAARGALGHWAVIRNGRIERYQIITPTAWNGSPRDDRDVPGPWEQALVGTPVADAGNPVEAGHVIRSFDPCLVCTVHAVDLRGNVRGHWRGGV